MGPGAVYFFIRIDQKKHAAPAPIPLAAVVSGLVLNCRAIILLLINAANKQQPFL